MWSRPTRLHQHAKGTYLTAPHLISKLTTVTKAQQRRIYFLLLYLQDIHFSYLYLFCPYHIWVLTMNTVVKIALLYI